jgi:organic radical activating enzyme
MNKQKPVKSFMDPLGHVRVHEIFASVQFEGPLCGTPAVFIRLYGCNLQCPRCDTIYTEENGCKEIWGPMSILRLLETTFHDYSTVVITGGEPFHQNVKPLTDALLDQNYNPYLYVYLDDEKNLCFAKVRTIW